MGRYSRDEIERAFQRYQDMGLAAARSGDWSLWGQMFTEDCAYHEHSLGEWGGREAVVREMAALMHKTEETPWIWCNQYPVKDYVIDEDRGWVWSMIWNRMEDPGNAQVFECNCLTMLYYAGDGQFSFEEDLYNPLQFQQMMEDWLAVKENCEAEEKERGPLREARAAAARELALDKETPAPELSLTRPAHSSTPSGETPVGRYARAEIAEAFDGLCAAIAKSGRTNDWRHLGAVLTADTTWVDCSLGRLGKRDAVVREIEDKLHVVDEATPWAYLNCFPPAEYTIDEGSSSVWAFFWARFRDPGDGSRHEAKLFLRAVYEGDGLFKEIETLYNPTAFEGAMESWKEAKQRYDERRERRAKRLAEREAKALAAAPLKI